MCRRQFGSIRFCDRAYLEAHSLWIHEWNCIHSDRGPIAVVLRVLCFGCRLSTGVNRVRERTFRGSNELGGVGDRDALHDRHLGLQVLATEDSRVLIAVVGATLGMTFLPILDREQLSVVGTLPQGLPGLRLPHVSFSDLHAMMNGSVAIALVAFADTSVLSRIYAQRAGLRVDANKELLSLGIINMATGLFQGFAVSASASRTPVAEQAGAKTQVAGLVGALLVTILLYFSPALLKNMPHAALSAVVICACLGQIEVGHVVRLYRLRRSEFFSSIACFLGVVLLGVIQGIFIAVGLALLAFIWRAWRPHNAVLGRVDGMKGYHDIRRHPEARRIPGLVLFRWDAPLFFANAAVFEERVQLAIATAPTPTSWVVIAAEPVTDVDVTAADMLVELDKKLHEAGMDLCFAEMKGPVKDLLKKYGLFESFGTANFFPTLGQAVDRYLAIHQVPWQDWDEQVVPEK